MVRKNRRPASDRTASGPAIGTGDQTKGPRLRGGLPVAAFRCELHTCLLQFTLDFGPLTTAEVKAAQFGAQHLDVVV